MSRDPQAFDQLTKAVAERTMTRRQILAGVAGTVVVSYLGPDWIFGPALAQAVSLPTCNTGAGVTCDVTCGAFLASCVDICADSAGLGCKACLKAASKVCATCPQVWDCTCTNGGSLCNGALVTSGAPGTCCDPDQTCFSPGICQGPCDAQQCLTVTILGCIFPCAGQCCDGRCTFINEDPQNCGGCGNVCSSGQTCCSDQTDPLGDCVDTQTDPNNCGGCNAACPAGQTCENGICSTSICPQPCTSGTGAPGECCSADAVCCNADAGYCCPPNTTCCFLSEVSFHDCCYPGDYCENGACQAPT
jgi:Stigma-specific protein, Stig1